MILKKKQPYRLTFSLANFLFFHLKPLNMWETKIQLILAIPPCLRAQSMAACMWDWGRNMRITAYLVSALQGCGYIYLVSSPCLLEWPPFAPDWAVLKVASPRTAVAASPTGDLWGWEYWPLTPQSRTPLRIVLVWGKRPVDEKNTTLQVW